MRRLQGEAFGPEAALAYHLATDPELKGQQWFIVKYAAPGTSLNLHWQNNFDLSGKMMNYVESCVNTLSKDYDVQIRSFLWMQGENDAIKDEFEANKVSADSYAVNEQNLVSAFRLKFAKYATRPNGSVPGSGIGFITAGIAPAGKDGLYLWEYSDIVNEAKVNNTRIWYVPGTLTEYSALWGKVPGPGRHENPSGAIYNSAYIDTSLMSTQTHDTAHYDQQSMDWLGTWFGQYVDVLINEEGTGGSSGSTTLNKTTYGVKLVDGSSTRDVIVAQGGYTVLGTIARANYTFLGWSDGTNTYAAGDIYTPTKNVTLTAQWEGLTYTITYDPNGGSVEGSSQPITLTYRVGEKITLPKCDRENWQFDGWYDGVTTYGQGSTIDAFNTDKTLTARWRARVITITWDYNDGSTPNKTTDYTCNTDNQGVPWVYIESFEKPTRSGYTFQGWYSAETGKNHDNNAVFSSYNCTDKTFVAQWKQNSSGECVTPDTLITLADGSKKRIDEVTYEDQLLVWDFFKGEYAVVPSVLIVNHGYDNWTVIELSFSDGSSVKAITAHGFFDESTNAWELINPENAREYIGHSFVKATDDGYTSVELISVDIYEEYTESYSLVTAIHYNFITNDLFSLTTSVNGMMSGLVIGEDMKYDQAVLAEDIATYGLYSYADFEKYITYEQYFAFNGDYLKISVGKGKLKFEDILALINTYL